MEDEHTIKLDPEDVAIIEEEMESLGLSREEETTGTPPETEAENASEPTAEEIMELYRSGELLTKEKASEVVQKRLSREKQARESATQKAREEAEAKALEDQKEYAELAEKRAKKIAELEQKVEQSQQLADSRLVESELTRSLIGEGARSERIAKMLKDPDLPKPEIEDGKVGDSAKFLVAAKQEYPEWFGESSASGASPSGTSSNKIEEARQRVKAIPESPEGVDRRELSPEQQEKMQQASDRSYELSF